MSLRFRWEWEPASGVRTPELAATWCRLMIDVADTPATLVERRNGSGGPRHGLDASAYPLAEHLAVNWWQLNTGSHVPSDRGVRLAEAGGGFAWPDLTLRSDRGLVRASLRQRDEHPEHVRFLTQVEAVLDAESVLAEIAEFVEATVRQLEDQGIAGTLLQGEWSAIQQAEAAERDYCLVAAAWGHDPYNTPDDVERSLLIVGGEIGDAGLLADLARAVPLTAIVESAAWVREASRAVDQQLSDWPVHQVVEMYSVSKPAPWRVGYEGARKMRDLLHLDPTEPARLDDLVSVSRTESAAPMNVDGLVGAGLTSSSVALVVGSNLNASTRRFAAARAVGRRSLSLARGRSLITRASTYTDRTERAFAAELLAPASGIAELIAGDLSDDAIQRAAKHFDVTPLLVQHQVDNQLAV